MLAWDLHPTPPTPTQHNSNFVPDYWKQSQFQTQLQTEDINQLITNYIQNKSSDDFLRMLGRLPSLLETADHMILGALFLFSLVVIILIMSSNCVQIQIDWIADRNLWIKKVSNVYVMFNISWWFRSIYAAAWDAVVLAANIRNFQRKMTVMCGTYLKPIKQNLFISNKAPSTDWRTPKNGIDGKTECRFDPSSK